MSSTIYVKKKKLSNKLVFNKMVFIMNALENGWKIKKRSNRSDKYIFYKKHCNETETKNDLFLESFIENCLSIDHLFSV